ncbi:LysR family transcriptional regulator [Photobacterium galatheae]|uniref:LysR substrate-binding domain-containing protein n=1 Tax=Photobacterium galatheae TaxID=1654360 RepID=UPI00202CA6B6|nr:LysR substrate-binding domain-containing protein [Photobacterium galatheae]MCM0148761.1 LysR family transcriptional regulator [Photobacterium galatheae]
MFAHLPPLNSIRTFESAARHLSFKHAAEELHVTPTAVSHQIRLLEEKLSTQLFERQTRAIKLTEDGERLLVSAHQALQLLNTTVNDLKHTANNITISTTAAFASMWLVPRLESFRTLHPNITISLKTGEQLEDVAQDRRVDLAIRYGKCPADDPQVYLLRQEQFEWVATPAYWKAQTQTESITVFVTRWQNAALPAPDIHAFLAVLAGADRPIQVRYFDQENQTIQAALAGQGLALISKLLIEQALDQGWLTPHPTLPPVEPSGLEYYTVVPERHRHSAPILAFQRWLLKSMSVDSTSTVHL